MAKVFDGTDAHETPDTECIHSKCQPKWDPNIAKGKSAMWIRQHMPRFSGTCPDCGQLVIIYASSEQYILGDY